MPLYGCPAYAQKSTNILLAHFFSIYGSVYIIATISGIDFWMYPSTVFRAIVAVIIDPIYLICSTILVYWSFPHIIVKVYEPVFP